MFQSELFDKPIKKKHFKQSFDQLFEDILLINLSSIKVIFVLTSAFLTASIHWHPASLYKHRVTMFSISLPKLLSSKYCQLKRVKQESHWSLPTFINITNNRCSFNNRGSVTAQQNNLLFQTHNHSWDFNGNFSLYFL